jgi:hypothetical protein
LTKEYKNDKFSSQKPFTINKTTRRKTMDTEIEEAISANLRVTLPTSSIALDWVWHGRGVFEVKNRSRLPHIKDAVQRADPHLAITAMAMTPDGWLIVNFDSIT